MSSATATVVVLGAVAIASLSMTSRQDSGVGAKPQAAGGAAATDEIQRGLQPFEAMLGEWEGTLGGPPPAAGAKPDAPLAIVWSNAWSFDGRWIRMEFASTQPGPRGNHLEFLGLMTFNPTEKRIESIWMNPRIRMRDDHFIDSREMFFEKGSWDAAGKVLTLIAPKQNGVDAPTIEVRSTFTIVDADHFTCVDAEKDATTGEWKPVTHFELTRRK
jgi:hypothetical protein